GGGFGGPRGGPPFRVPPGGWGGRKALGPNRLQHPPATATCHSHLPQQRHGSPLLAPQVVVHSKACGCATHGRMSTSRGGLIVGGGASWVLPRGRRKGTTRCLRRDARTCFALIGR